MEQKKSKFYRFLEPVIPRFLRPTVLKYQELLSYLVFGVLSTVVNFAVYFPLNLIAPGIVANIPAWVAAVAFAFVTNKAFVFENGGWDRATLWPQLRDFTAARIFSLVLEEAVFLLFVQALHLPETWVKLLGQVIVVVTNYITGKLIVFKKK